MKIPLSISFVASLVMAAPTPAVAALNAGDIAAKLGEQVFETGIDILMKQFIDQDPFKDAVINVTSTLNRITINITKIRPIVSDFDLASFDFKTGKTTQVDGKNVIADKDVTWQGTVALSAKDGSDSPFCMRNGNASESDNIAIVTTVQHIADPHNAIRTPGTPLNIPHTVNAAQIASSKGKCQQSFDFTDISRTVIEIHDDSVGKHSDAGFSKYSSNIAYDKDPSYDDYDIEVGSLLVIAEHSTEPVPGPLPILGLGAVFGYSRKLKKLIKTRKSPEL